MNVSNVYNVVRSTSTSTALCVGAATILVSGVGILAYRYIRHIASDRRHVREEQAQRLALRTALTAEQLRCVDLIEALAAKALQTPSWYCYEGAFRVPGNVKHVQEINQQFEILSPDQWTKYIDEIANNSMYAEDMLSVVKSQVRKSTLNRVDVEQLAPSLEKLIREVLAQVATTRMTEQGMNDAFRKHVLTDEEIQALTSMSSIAVPKSSKSFAAVSHTTSLTTKKKGLVRRMTSFFTMRKKDKKEISSSDKK